MAEHKNADEIVKNMTEKFDKNYGDTTIKGIRDVFNMCVNCVNQTPTADVVEVKRGYWIDKPSGRYSHVASWCSVCGNKSGIGGIESNRHKPYCPNCGAKMDGTPKERGGD